MFFPCVFILSKEPFKILNSPFVIIIDLILLLIYQIFDVFLTFTLFVLCFLYLIRYLFKTLFYFFKLSLSFGLSSFKGCKLIDQFLSGHLKILECSCSLLGLFYNLLLLFSDLILGLLYGCLVIFSRVLDSLLECFKLRNDIIIASLDIPLYFLKVKVFFHCLVTNISVKRFSISILILLIIN